jgi:hypothetical protein
MREKYKIPKEAKIFDGLDGLMSEKDVLSFFVETVITYYVTNLTRYNQARWKYFILKEEFIDVVHDAIIKILDQIKKNKTPIYRKTFRNYFGLVTYQTFTTFLKEKYERIEFDPLIASNTYWYTIESYTTDYDEQRIREYKDIDDFARIWNILNTQLDEVDKSIILGSIILDKKVSVLSRELNKTSHYISKRKKFLCEFLLKLSELEDYDNKINYLSLENNK